MSEKGTSFSDHVYGILFVPVIMHLYVHVHVTSILNILSLLKIPFPVWDVCKLDSHEFNNTAFLYDFILFTISSWKSYLSIVQDIIGNSVQIKFANPDYLQT